MKVLLLSPPSPPNTTYVRVDRCMQRVEAWNSMWQPMTLCYMKNLLLENGHEAKVLDATAEKLDVEITLKRVEEYAPQLVVINTSIPTIYFDDSFSARVKKRTNAKTVAIGMPPTLIPDECKNFDFLIKGEAEFAILEVIKKFNNEQRIFLKKIDDMNSLPLPDVSDLVLDAYTVPFTHERLILAETARGCPYNCIFCIAPLYFGKRVRYMNPERVVDELQVYKEKYRIRNFLFWCDTYTLNKKIVSETCDQIKKRGLDISWMSINRVDTVNKEILSKMHSAGCFITSFGVESGCQQILDNAKKGTTIKQIEDGIRAAREAKLWSMAHIIFGLPGENRETYNYTVKWIKKINPDYIQAYCAVPYPGTELRKIAEKNNWIISNDYSKYEITNAVMRNADLTAKEISEMRIKAYKEFYSRPKIVFRELFRHPSVHTFTDGLGFFRKWVLGKD